MFVKTFPDPTVAAPIALQIPVPFLNNAAGVGDLVARLTQAVGIQPCSLCEQRRQLLNQIQFRPWGEW